MSFEAFSIYDSQGNPINANPNGSLSVQKISDTGRIPITIVVDRIASTTTEAALISLSINRGGSTTAASSYTVTAGKTLRIQNIIFSTRVNTTNVGITSSRLRLRGEAAVTITSPIFANLEISPKANAIDSVGDTVLPIPDGLEFAAGQQIGFTNLNGSASTTWSMCVIGYEY